MLTYTDLTSVLPNLNQVLYWAAIALLGIGVAQLSTQLTNRLLKSDDDDQDEDSNKES